MGGGGGILSPITDTLFGSPQTVATPDYTGAANATAANNLAAAQAATAANRVNQVTPYGNLNYTQTGTDSQGNPMWTATQSIDPSLQGAVDKSKSAVSGFDFNQFNPTGLPSTGINPGQSYTDAIMQRLAPTQQHQSEMSDQQLANQGIMPGSEAYNNAKRLLAQSQNDQLTSAVTGGMGVGLQANQQAYNQQTGTYTTNLNAPFNYASNVKAFASPSYVTPSQQTTTAGADITGAMGLTNQNQQANANAANAQSNAMMSGLFTLGGAGIAKYSDIRTKENIELVGYLPNGLSVYEYEYKPEWKNEAGYGKHIGVMAQEVEKILPYAVITLDNGYKMVNYGLI
jgi:hypothetical protein